MKAFSTCFVSENRYKPQRFFKAIYSKVEEGGVRVRFLLSSNKNDSNIAYFTISETDEIMICICTVNWDAFPFWGFNSIQVIFETYLS